MDNQNQPQPTPADSTSPGTTPPTNTPEPTPTNTAATTPPVVDSQKPSAPLSPAAPSAPEPAKPSALNALINDHPIPPSASPASPASVVSPTPQPSSSLADKTKSDVLSNEDTPKPASMAQPVSSPEQPAPAATPDVSAAQPNAPAAPSASAPSVSTVSPQPVPPSVVSPTAPTASVTSPMSTDTPTTSSAATSPAATAKPTPPTPEEKSQLESEAKKVIADLDKAQQESQAAKAAETAAAGGSNKPPKKKMSNVAKVAAGALVAMVLTVGGLASYKLLETPGTAENRSQAASSCGTIVCQMPDGSTQTFGQDPNAPHNSCQERCNEACQVDQGGTVLECNDYDPTAPGGNFTIQQSGSCLVATNNSGAPVSVTKYCYICSGPANDGCNPTSGDFIETCNQNGQQVVVNDGESGVNIVCAPSIEACQNYQIDAVGGGTSNAIVGEHETQGAACVTPTVTPSTEPLTCDGVTGSMANFNGGTVGLTQPLAFTAAASGTGINNIEVCFHGNFEGPGWSTGWQCLRDISPSDGSFPISQTNPATSDFTLSPDGSLNFQIVKSALISTGHTGALIDQNGIIWGTNVMGSGQAACMSNNATCSNASCSGSFGLTTPPPTITPTPTTPVTPTPTLPPLACVDLNYAPNSPEIGTTVALTCDGSSGADYADFQMSRDGGAYQNLPRIDDFTAQFLVAEAGQYSVRCRVCRGAESLTAAECTNYQVIGG